jgi:hypothetical protein
MIDIATIVSDLPDLYNPLQPMQNLQYDLHNVDYAEKVVRSSLWRYLHVPNNFFPSKNCLCGPNKEPIWRIELFSKIFGTNFYIFLVSLFGLIFSQNSTCPDTICFSAETNGSYLQNGTACIAKIVTNISSFR